MSKYHARVHEIEQILDLWKHQEAVFVQHSQQIIFYVNSMFKQLSKNKNKFSMKRRGGTNSRGRTKKNVKISTYGFSMMLLLLFWCQLIQAQTIQDRYSQKTSHELMKSDTIRTSVPFKISKIMSVVQMILPPSMVNMYDDDSRQIYEIKSVIDLINKQYIVTDHKVNPSSPYVIQEDCNAIFSHKNVQRILEQEALLPLITSDDYDEIEDEIPELTANDKYKIRQTKRNLCSRNTAVPRMEIKPTNDGIQVLLHVSRGGNYLELEQELKHILKKLEDTDDEKRLAHMLKKNSVEHVDRANEAVILQIKKMLFMMEKIEPILDSYHNEVDDFSKILHSSWKMLDYYLTFHKIRMDYTSPQELLDMEENIKIQVAKDRITMIQANANRNTASSYTQYFLAPLSGSSQGVFNETGIALKTAGEQLANAFAIFLNKFFYESAGALLGLASLLIVYKWSFRHGNNNNNKQLQLENEELKKDMRALTAMVTQLHTHLALLPASTSSPPRNLAILPPSTPPRNLALLPAPPSPSPKKLTRSPTSPKTSREKSKKNSHKSTSR